MSFRLLSVSGDQEFELVKDRTYVVGRAVTSEIPIFDPTISRRHAELRVSAAGAQVKDLGSSNGTFINGARITDGTLSAGDSITFGKVVFQLLPRDLTPSRPVSTGAQQPPPGGTIVRKIMVSGGAQGIMVPSRRSAPPRPDSSSWWPRTWPTARPASSPSCSTSPRSSRASSTSTGCSAGWWK